MESIQRYLKKRKSAFDVKNAENVISSVAFTAILVVVLLLVIAIIFGLSIWQANGLENNTTTIKNSIIGMVINFFALMPTVGTILAVVVLIAAIVILVLYVKRMAQSGQSQGFQG
jgi:uncharacterized protein YqgC (DUF456 family)